MTKSKFRYGWAIKWVLAALLMAAGVLMKIYQEDVVYATTGIAIVLFSLLRVVPLLKTLKKEVLRTINLIEIIFDTILGIVMIYVVFSGKSTDVFWINMYGYLLAFFFLSRGIIYFISLYYFGEKSESMKFWFHMLCMALGPVILTLTVLNKDIITTLGWVVLFISISGGGYLGYDGFGGYKKYRESSKSLNEDKKIEKDSKFEKDLPKPVPEVEKEKETYIN